MSSMSDDQKRVVHSRSSSFVVRASAGAGKTRVLVEKYVRHVAEDGLRPDQILAITFTRKAAAEMKRRIVSMLAERGLAEAAQIAETGPIQTIHSFCERVLRECCIDAGLDPEFTVLPEADTARLVYRAIQDAIADAASGSLEDRLIGALAGKPHYGSTAPHAKLEEALRGTLEKLRGSTHDRHALEARHEDPAALLDCWRVQWLATLDGALAAAFDTGDPSLPFAQRVKRAYKSLKRAVPKGLPNDADGDAEEERALACAAQSCALVRLVCSAWRKLEESMEASQSLDFVALESRAVRMLEESEAARARIRSEYAVVLVDEAQDLSPLQYRLLTSLGIEAEMMVGDSQQSIYGFRQADVRLFLEKSQQTETLFLSKNHRSDPGILAFVDHVFRQEWGDDYRAMGPGSESFDPSRPPAPWEGVELWEQRAKDTAQVARWIAELLDEGVRPGEIAVLVRERSYAHSLIAKLDGLEINYRLVGGSERFYTRLEVRDLANALTCLSDPYDDFALLATLRSPIAGLSLDSIALLAMRKPVVEALSDFEPPVDEDRQLLAGFLTWYEPLRKCADRRPAYELLIELFARAPYWENLAARPRAYQTLANVRKLFRLAASHPEMGAEELSSRLREIRDLRHREGDAPAIDDQADAVSVLTIHKAKGLEFPIVVLPDMFGRLVRQVGEIETEKWLGVVAAEFEGPKCAYLQWIAERRKERERAELMRVLYVGMTRAQKRLCLVTHPLASTSNLAGRVALLSGFVDGELPGVRVRR